MPVKYLVTMASGSGITSESIEEIGPYPVYGGNGRRGFASEFTHDGTRVLLGRQGALCGNVHLVSGRYWASEHAIVVKPSRLASPRWLAYMFESMNLGQYSQSAAQPGIAADVIGNLRVPVPPLPVQNGIADFLDRETVKVDALIDKQNQLIATLREDRTATITRAVTKGLNPDAEMKDSGAVWLGRIPVHWTATQLGRLCRSISDGPHFSPSYVDEGVMFLSARNIRPDRWSLDDAKFISEEDYREFSRRVVPQVGDVLYTKGGTTGIARVVDITDRFQVWVHVAVLKIRQEIVLPEFLAYSLNSAACYDQSQLYTRGATNNDLGLTRMVRIRLALPPKEVQQEIVTHLNTVTASIDALIVKATEVISTLREYRSALIAATVTGRIDVRKAKA
ncbi:restriction endonuclease subunit S [Rhodococcus erythropolis]|uniref:restriction endonuclease subunit S n=1 Tax=Rhodococcus erythropolis TaxID=1833 RepID=UPI002554ABCA|nr:restriction endonuclease subunit S [Rhodococcus erythropolis]